MPIDLYDKPELFKGRLKKSILERYRGNPEGLANFMGIVLPEKPHAVMKYLGKYDGIVTPGLRELVLDVCNLRVYRAGAKAPRGGGKSLGFAFIEFYLNNYEGFDWLNLGGSEAQALQVYGYLKDFIDSSEEFQAIYPDTIQTFTKNEANGGWIRVLTASPKSIRSPHAGGNKVGVRADEPARGGGLTIDEECECEESIVKGAKPTVDTAKPSIILRGSTFHKLQGTFQQLCDNAEEIKYSLYDWDCFDVAERCMDKCENCINDFANDVYHTVTDELGNTTRELLHPAYCGGKAHFSDGWLAIEEIKQAWVENTDSEWFEVEMMGSRPSSAGKVIKNMTKFNAVCVVPMLDNLPGHCTITIDWGMKSECCVQVWQEQRGGICALLECEHFIHQESETYIYEVVKGFGQLYHTNRVRADSSHPYCNSSLRNEPRYRMQVEDIYFQVEKDLAVGALNAKVDAGLVRIPEKHKMAIQQMRNWRKKNGKIVKKDDHACDAAICFFSKFSPEDIARRTVRIVPQTLKVGG